MIKIIGRFYFKRTNHFNLLGEFSNNTSIRNLTESCNIEREFDVNSFEGDYRTTWFENGVNVTLLKIAFKEATDQSIYTLQWLDDNVVQIFWGEGFVVDGILIGDYRNFEVI